MTVATNKRETLETAAKRRQNEMVDIEIILERGENCIRAISTELDIHFDIIHKHIIRMVKSGTVVKTRNQVIDGRHSTMYALADSVPRQSSFMDRLEVRRDYLVAAFFGEQTCVTP